MVEFVFSLHAARAPVGVNSSSSLRRPRHSAVPESLLQGIQEGGPVFVQ